MNTTTTTESAEVCGQSSNSADNLRTRETPDYGEPWEATNLHFLTTKGNFSTGVLASLHSKRIAHCVNACQGMTDPATEIQAMREAIEEAETSLTDIAEYWNQDENESAMSDACWHAIGTAKKALEKLKPFLTQES